MDIKSQIKKVVDNKTLKTYESNKLLYNDSSWYRQKRIKLIMYLVLTFFLLIVGLFLSTATIKNLDPDTTKEAVVSTGISFIILGAVSLIYFSYKTWIHTLTFKYYGKKEELESLTELSKEKYSKWKKKRKEINEELLMKDGDNDNEEKENDSKNVNNESTSIGNEKISDDEENIESK